MIKAQWTPQNTVFHRRTNVYPLYTGKGDLLSRVTTFDGLAVSCKIEEKLSPSLTRDIESILLNTYDSVNSVSGYHSLLSSMTVFLKQDASGRLWMLFCTNLKIRQ